MLCGVCCLLLVSCSLLIVVTLPPTNLAPGDPWKMNFPLKDPPLCCHVRGREGSSEPISRTNVCCVVCVCCLLLVSCSLLIVVTLPPTNLAPGDPWKMNFPLKGPPLSCHVRGREGSSEPISRKMCVAWCVLFVASELLFADCCYPSSN